MFLNENVWILVNTTWKFDPKGPINNILALVQIMAWCRPGDKTLSEPMMVTLVMHICVTQPQWVNLCCHHMPLMSVCPGSWLLRTCCLWVEVRPIILSMDFTINSSHWSRQALEPTVVGYWSCIVALQAGSAAWKFQMGQHSHSHCSQICCLYSLSVDIMLFWPQIISH